MSFKHLHQLALLMVLASGGLASAVDARATVDLRIDARPMDEPIRVHVLVEEAGGPVSGLSAADFAVTLDGNPVTGFELTQPRSQGAEVRASIAIATGSPSYANLIRQLKVGDRAAIVKYRNRPIPEAVVQYMSVLPFTEIDGAAGTDAAIEFLEASPAYYATWSFGEVRPWPVFTALDAFDSPPSPLPEGLRVLIGGADTGSFGNQAGALDRSCNREQRLCLQCRLCWRDGYRARCRPRNRGRSGRHNGRFSIRRCNCASGRVAERCLWHLDSGLGRCRLQSACAGYQRSIGIDGLDIHPVRCDTRAVRSGGRRKRRRGCQNRLLSCDHHRHRKPGPSGSHRRRLFHRMRIDVYAGAWIHPATANDMRSPYSL